MTFRDQTRDRDLKFKSEARPRRDFQKCVSRPETGLENYITSARSLWTSAPLLNNALCLLFGNGTVSRGAIHILQEPVR